MASGYVRDFTNHFAETSIGFDADDRYDGSEAER